MEKGRAVISHKNSKGIYSRNRNNLFFFTLDLFVDVSMLNVLSVSLHTL